MKQSLQIHTKSFPKKNFVPHMPGICFIGSNYHKGHNEKTEVEKVGVCKRPMLNPGEIY